MHKNKRSNHHHQNIYLRLCYRRPQLCQVVLPPASTVSGLPRFTLLPGVSCIISNNDSVDRASHSKINPPTYRENNARFGTRIVQRIISVRPVVGHCGVRSKVTPSSSSMSIVGGVHVPSCLLRRPRRLFVLVL